MGGMIFEWDAAKDIANQKKHGISFEEASYVFYDPLLVMTFERIVNGEERWQTFGMVGDIRIVMVAHTIADDSGSEVFRLISARAATKRERRNYEEQNG
jgi:uncharacterized protein